MRKGSCVLDHTLLERTIERDMQRWGGRKLSALIVRLSSCESRDDTELSQSPRTPFLIKYVYSLILANLLALVLAFVDIDFNFLVS